MSALSPRLAALAQTPPRTAPVAQEERCELCGLPIPERHRHVADVVNRTLLCACHPCSVLLGHRGASGGHYRLVPERRLRLEGVESAALDVPVGLAFFFFSTPAGRVIALYPSPLGATESQLELDAWDELVRENAVLGELEPDVEALLVNCVGGIREHFLVPIDDCYALVGAVKRHEGVERFFERLRKETG